MGQQKSKEKTGNKILMIGLSGAGKTTILYKMKEGKIVSSVSTMGFNVEELQYKNAKFTIWDVGSGNMQAFVRHYYVNTEAVIFVVDSSDEEGIEIARTNLLLHLEQEELKKCPLLVLANKSDVAKTNPALLIQQMEL